MPAKDYSQPVFMADANAANDWGSIGVGVAVDFRASAEFDRGLDLDLGLMAIANLDASFSKFLAANLQGTAQAQASVRAQIELPLNLFDEVGVAVRLQAIAELAAGVRLGVGVALGDFLALAGENLRGGDISARLLRIFIEESQLEIGFYAKAAFTAQAYANLVITGSALPNAARGTEPGFTIAAGAGAGLEAGAGYQAFGAAGIANFSRLVARSADVVVDETVQRLAHALPDSAAGARAVLFGLRPGFKIALRIAFELGEQFAGQALQHDAAGRDALSARGLQVILEELQRAVCEGAIRAASERLQTLLTPLQAAQNVWDACRVERHALADALESAPHPFSNADSLTYWLDLMTRAVALAARLAGSEPKLMDAASIGWAALKLAARISERVNRANAGVSVIGVPPQSVEAAFTGPMTGSVPPEIANVIRNTLAANGVNVSGALDYSHLALYLAQKTIVDLVMAANPGLKTFLDDVRGAIASDVTKLVGLVLANASSFPVGSGAPDPVAVVSTIANGVQAYVANRLTNALRAQLEPAFAGQDDLRIYFDEVLVATLKFALAVITQEVIGWATSNRTSKAVTEALSAILLKLLSRSLVAIADTVSAHVQEQMSDLLRRAANQATRPNGLVDVLTANPAVHFAADEISELVQDALLVAADVFGPFPEDRRARIRGLMYDVLDPAGPTPGDQLMTALENQQLIPNENKMRELAEELGQLATERFVLFVEGLVMRTLARVGQDFIAALEAALQVAEQFLAGIAQAISLIAHRLEEIAHDLQVQAEKIADAAADALGDLDALLDSFSSNSGRTRFVNELASTVASSGLAVLEDNWAYQNIVPGNIKNDIQDKVREVVADLLEASPFEELLAAIGLIRDQFEDILDDARSLDLGAPLAPQVAELLIARLASLVADRYGNIHIKISFGFHWNTPLGRVDQDFDLGRIKVHVGDVADIIRPMARALGAFEQAVDSLTARIRAILDAELASLGLHDEEDAVRGEHARLSSIAAEQQAGAKSLVIERPAQMQTAGADTRVVIRLEGFSPAVLTVDADTPQRLFIVLNGEPVSLDSFHLDVELPATLRPDLPNNLGAQAGATAGNVGAITSRPGALAVRGGAIGATVQQRSRNAARATPARTTPTRFGASSRATLGSVVQGTRTVDVGSVVARITAPVRISGSLPSNLLKPGLNTLTAVVVAGPGQRVSDTVGFLLAQTLAKPGLGPLVPPPRGLKGLPKSVVGALSKGVMLPAERKRLAKQLETAHPRAPIKPLARISARSPLLAERFGLLKAPASPPRGVLRVAPRKEVPQKEGPQKKGADFA